VAGRPAAEGCRMKNPAQWEIVLRELRASGSRGVHTFELRRMFIGNPSQRIAELEGKGYVVTATRERLHGDAVGSRYVLVSEPGQQPAPKPTPHEPGGSLFNQPAARCAIFDDWEDAA
jgi:hypothetical protein